ncbi:MAG TPA: chloride channel protein [Verrucomicrobiae bacterium]|nr:chloride channel protein [Verrucomicrobiae bacterium]
MAVVIGALSAGVAYVLLWLIWLITNVTFHHRFTADTTPPLGTPMGNHLGWITIFMPVIGALVVGFMARYGSPKIRGHGIPEALEAILLGRSRIEPKVAILKPISTAISLGTGGPFGAEGPIIMTGGAFGSLIAQMFHLTAAERKTLLAAGAAGGMAAVFATPIAAVLLAVELLLFEWRPRSFIPVAVSASVSAALRVPLLGAGPVFPGTVHAPLSGSILLAAVIVGIIAGFGSGLVTNLIYGVEDMFAKLPIHWMWWPAIGAVVVGVGGWLDPRVLGAGYDSIRALLQGQVIGAALLGLLIGKAIVWAIALGSGTSGGVLAPLLIIGGALGAVIGHWLPVGDPALWAMVGMAAMMGGTMRAPFTGVVFTLEATHDLNALPALLIGCVCALGVTVLLLRRSILTEKLARRGQHITCEYSIDPFELLRVGEVMDANPPVAPATMTVGELSSRIAQGNTALSKRQGTLLLDAENNLAGIVTRGDLLKALQQDPTGQRLLVQVGSSKPIVAYADEPLNEAINRMLKNNIGRLPVVDRANPRLAVGYIGRSNVMAARTRSLEEEELREGGTFGKFLPIQLRNGAT